MTKLEEAKARLGSALNAVEQTALPLVEARSESTKQAGRVAELSEERERLLARLAELEDDARSVTAINEEIETRLDSAIGEVRAALGR